jgi:GNAT superfamily N-acetyltransferase
MGRGNVHGGEFYVIDFSDAWNAGPCDTAVIDEIARLGAVVSGDRTEVANAGFLRWQYLDNPTGKAIVWLAREIAKGRLVGSYAVIPIPLKIGDKEIVGSLSLNTMTHPEFRGKGIFTALARLTYDSCLRQGFELTMGYPNPLSYHGFVKSLEFTDLGHNEILFKVLRINDVVANSFQKSTLKIILRLIALLQSKGKGSDWTSTATEGIVVEEVRHFDKRFDDLWDRVSTQTTNAVVRKSSYLNWRFACCPGRKYRIFSAVYDSRLVGYAVATISTHPKLGATRVAYIVDVIVEMRDDDVLWRTLIAQIEAWAHHESAAVVVAYLPRHMRCYGALKKLRYLSLPSSARGGSGAFIVRLHSAEDLDVNTVCSFKNWYVMPGDNDHP